MTEYDYSPEAYQRYMDTQNRIARWVDNTNAHAHEFRHPFGLRSDIASPSSREYQSGSFSRDLSQSHGSRVSSGRRNSISYQPRGSTSKGSTATASASNRQSYPYPLPRSHNPASPAPLVSPPKPSHSRVPVPKTTQTRPRSLSQSYPSTRDTSSVQRRDSRVSHSRTGSRSYAPPSNSASHGHHASTHAHINPKTGNPPARSGTYPVYSSKPSHSKPLVSTSHVTSHSRDRTHSLSHTHHPTSRTSGSRSQHVIPPTSSGVTSPASGSRTVYTVTKPTNVGGYTIVPGGGDVRIVYS
ncbi:hypothetical protein VKT23_011739 [Stygiomarasmius scandens]|uniref:Uncharacterized protein n=1 Tax=Marasmiellus scandens TaxID=2682957 RepID=A0ABR1JCJ1_9AGAR